MTVPKESGIRTLKGGIQLKEKRIYLAGPYSHSDKAVRSKRLAMLSIAAGLLMKQNHLVFSPISHSGLIVDFVRSLPSEPDFWLRQCDSYLEHWTSLLAVLPMDGADISVGVKHEISRAKALGIPILLATGLLKAVQDYCSSWSRESGCPIIEELASRDLLEGIWSK